MKEQNKITLLLLFFVASIMAFAQCQPRHSKKNVKVHTFTVANPNQNASDPNDDFIWWYLIYSNDGGYYSYSSPTRANSFTGATFSYSKTLGFNKEEAKEETLEEIDEESLPDEVAEGVAQTETEEAETEADNAEGESEGNGESSEGSSEGSDGSSSDGGSSDGGGGGGE